MTFFRAIPLVAALVTSLALTRNVDAQSVGTIRGTVTDSASGRGIASARVVVVGTTRGAATDDQGRYTLPGVPAGRTTISVQRIGFASAERSTSVIAGQVVTLDVSLRAVTVMLDQVVTVGYGTTSRQNVTSAIASVDSSTFRNTPVAAIDNAIQGKIAGVQVIQNSGEPGGGVSLRVRGPASLNAGNQPLYVVDGVPVLQDNFEQLTSTSGQRQNPMSALNPNDVERIDVLKDAAATAIYGSRGSNGVVLITTKRGTAGSRMKFGLSTYAGSQTAEKKIELMNSKQYVEVMNENRVNRGLTPRYTPGVTDTVSVDWQDAIFRSAGISDVQLSANGGTDRIRAFLSGSSFDQKGIVLGSGYKRQSGRLNLDASATDKLSLSSSVNLTRERNNRVPGDLNVDGVVTNALAEQPFNPVFGTSFGFGGLNEGVLYSNPVATATFSSLTNTTLRGLGNLEARYAFTDRLTLTGRAGADIYGLDELRWRSPKVDQAAGAAVGGQGSTGHTTATRYLMESFGNYAAIQGDRHNLGLTLGTSAEYNSSNWNFLTGNTFPSGFETYVGSAASISDYAGSATSNNLVSFFTRANYSFADRYQLAASLRTDGSSRFGASNRFGFFPALSAAWTVTNEGFASPLARHAALKLRASVGTTGNQGIGDFASRTLVGTTSYNGASGLIGSQFGNPDLKWEETREVDLGADLTVLNGRVGIIADYYARNTSNLLVQRPVPSTSGYSTIWGNVGSIRNKGVDLGLHTVNVDGDKGPFGWTSDFNVTWNRNTVTELYGGLPITATTSGRVTSVAAVGQPLGTFYLFKFSRVDPANGNPLYLNAAGQEVLSTALVSADLAFVGNPQPNYYGGFTNTVTMGAFDLRGFLQFSQGGKVLNQMRIFMDDGGAVSDNKLASVYGRWQKAGDITTVPKMGSTGASLSNSSRFVEDGSFVRLGEITLGYKVPAGLLRTARFDNARIYVSGRNLKTWTDYTGYNPDVNSNASSNVVQGVDYYSYPLARTVTVGINAGW
ncbi:MAG: putative outer membrane protein [Gemmatimonadetes bacterium]|jgi:TonB-linked SusC/RagA family outer membrane protein|nr:putative outer membrane protein [Gemmatimonadota bacterium]